MLDLSDFELNLEAIHEDDLERAQEAFIDFKSLILELKEQEQAARAYFRNLDSIGEFLEEHNIGEDAILYDGESIPSNYDGCYDVASHLGFWVPSSMRC